jgi:hypothetical protein
LRRLFPAEIKHPGANAAFSILGCDTEPRRDEVVAVVNSFMHRTRAPQEQALHMAQKLLQEKQFTTPISNTIILHILQQASSKCATIPRTICERSLPRVCGASCGASRCGASAAQPPIAAARALR